MGRFLIFTCSLAAVFLNSCASVPDDEFTLEEALTKNTGIAVPIEITQTGRIILKDVKINGHEIDMVLDTGATKSAIYQATLKQLELAVAPDDETMVHGMTDAKQQPVVKLPNVEIGTLQYDEKSMVVLDDGQPDFQKMTIHDGLIGMDILGDYQIYLSTSKSELRLIPNNKPVFVSYFWPRINLTENPFEEKDRALHFVEIRVDGRLTPALLDTGSAFSVMNWSAASFAEAKSMRKKLEKDWVLQGALGTFKPFTKINLEHLRGGQIFWNNKDFVVMDMESLDILGIEDEPFILAGMNLFKEENIFIDFERNFLSIVPKRAELNNRSE